MRSPPFVATDPSSDTIIVKRNLDMPSPDVNRLVMDDRKPQKVLMASPIALIFLTPCARPRFPLQVVASLGGPSLS